MSEYYESDTVLHTWEPRRKFIGFMMLTFSFSFVRNLRAVPMMIVISSFLFIISKIPIKFLLKRWKVPSLFIIVMSIIFLLFSNGTVIYDIGIFNITKEGLVYTILMVTRFLCIITIIIILFETTSFLIIVKVMRSFGLPEILTDMIMLTYRYIFQIDVEIKKMQIAMKLRGFKEKGLKDLINYSFLVGSIFVRSYIQSDRVYSAMIIRGYGQKEVFKEKFESNNKDRILLGIFIILAFIIVVYNMEGM